MNKLLKVAALFIVLFCFIFSYLHAKETKPEKIIKVVVVDDAFRLSHKALKDFVYQNEKEIPDNYRDDDKNGHIDDVQGWDISDEDNDVSAPSGREEEFYHGTYIAGIITSVFKQFYGDEASRYLKIIPVKVLADNARNTYLADGYEGLKYACSLNPDVICCAWSGGKMPEELKAILIQAMQNGTVIVGSAGNLFTENVDFPAAFPGIFSVAAVDSAFKKTEFSNYGMRVDIAAPGASVYGPFPIADNAYSYKDGTSPATAFIAGCMAVLKASNPTATPQQLSDALKNTSMPLDSLNTKYAGKLGAGFPNMPKAIEYLKSSNYKYHAFDSSRPEGKIFYKKNQSPQTYTIKPSGVYKGIRLTAASSDYKGNVTVSGDDSLLYSGNINRLHKGVALSGSHFEIALAASPRPSKEMEFEYYMETIDSTTLYCSGTQTVREIAGILTDNSGNENYANHSACKWQLKAPEGKKIRIEFTAMDTQTNVDFIYLFDGTETLPENMLAKFSGTSLPPVITSLSNQVLIWFVTDGTITGRGWEMKYEPVDYQITID